MNYSTASFRTYFPLFLFRYEPTAKSSCSLEAGSKFKEAWTCKNRNCGSVSTGLFHPGVFRSMVTTNDHLLKELDETLERHKHRAFSVSYQTSKQKSRPPFGKFL
ncbi:hypothetical protein DPMN_047506 [Dreissena polymorpha]|uniref:Uncharacterized protein n=1 Tax=Dreissena polymorpha TaxID=45954 RepID=A0A9D4D9K4_DREPO|nr:hypothetical protein DPMN_047506 [Dreissena polymorpha]